MPPERSSAPCSERSTQVPQSGVCSGLIFPNKRRIARFSLVCGRSSSADTISLNCSKSMAPCRSNATVMASSVPGLSWSPISSMASLNSIMLSRPSLLRSASSKIARSSSSVKSMLSLSVDSAAGDSHMSKDFVRLPLSAWHWQARMCTMSSTPHSYSRSSTNRSSRSRLVHSSPTLPPSSMHPSTSTSRFSFSQSRTSAARAFRLSSSSRYSW
mmetsp:Transcript_47506/g.121252  ORF Transcript_47506/g.121252 Transcript_47506/m.121252 type:complete len:214 (+) Transcript_47506:177-818(+)